MKISTGSEEDTTWNFVNILMSISYLQVKIKLYGSKVTYEKCKQNYGQKTVRIISVAYSIILRKQGISLQAGFIWLNNMIIKNLLVPRKPGSFLTDRASFTEGICPMQSIR